MERLTGYTRKELLAVILIVLMVLVISIVALRAINASKLTELKAAESLYNEGRYTEVIRTIIESDENLADSRRGRELIRSSLDKLEEQKGTANQW